MDLRKSPTPDFRAPFVPRARSRADPFDRHGELRRPLAQSGRPSPRRPRARPTILGPELFLGAVGVDRLAARHLGSGLRCGGGERHWWQAVACPVAKCAPNPQQCALPQVRWARTSGIESEDTVAASKRSIMSCSRRRTLAPPGDRGGLRVLRLEPSRRTMPAEVVRTRAQRCHFSEKWPLTERIATKRCCVSPRFLGVICDGGTVQSRRLGAIFRPSSRISGRRRRPTPFQSTCEVEALPPRSRALVASLVTHSQS